MHNASSSISGVSCRLFPPTYRSINKRVAMVTRASVTRTCEARFRHTLYQKGLSVVRRLMWTRFFAVAYLKVRRVGKNGERGVMAVNFFILIRFFEERGKWAQSFFKVHPASQMSRICKVSVMLYGLICFIYTRKTYKRNSDIFLTRGYKTLMKLGLGCMYYTGCSISDAHKTFC